MQSKSDTLQINANDLRYAFNVYLICLTPKNRPANVFLASRSNYMRLGWPSQLPKQAMTNT